MTKEEFAIQFLHNILSSDVAAKDICKFCPNERKCYRELLTPAPVLCDTLGFLSKEEEA